MVSVVLCSLAVLNPPSQRHQVARLLDEVDLQRRLLRGRGGGGILREPLNTFEQYALSAIQMLDYIELAVS